tara:strand:- start:6006 stop:6191 length:186 start_codon:yes stop_codon:yes gene_type:complete
VTVNVTPATPVTSTISSFNESGSRTSVNGVEAGKPVVAATLIVVALLEIPAVSVVSCAVDE